MTEADFAALFRTHHRHLYAFCLRRVSHAHDAEDCAQEAFARAWRTLQRGTAPDDFRPWLFTIAARACNRRVAERRAVDIGVDAMDGDTASFEDGVVDALDGRKAARAVANAMADLEPTARTVVELAHDRGLTIGAIARTVGLRPRKVEASLFRSRRRLRATLR